MIDKIDFDEVNRKRSQLDMSFYAPDPTPSDVFMLLDRASELIRDMGLREMECGEYEYMFNVLIRERQGYE